PTTCAAPWRELSWPAAPSSAPTSADRSQEWDTGEGRRDGRADHAHRTGGSGTVLVAGPGQRPAGDLRGADPSGPPAGRGDPCGGRRPGKPDQPAAVDGLAHPRASPNLRSCGRTARKDTDSAMPAPSIAGRDRKRV